MSEPWRHLAVLAVHLRRLEQRGDVRDLALRLVHHPDVVGVKQVHDGASHNCLLEDLAELPVAAEQGLWQPGRGERTCGHRRCSDAIDFGRRRFRAFIIAVINVCI